MEITAAAIVALAALAFTITQWRIARGSIRVDQYYSSDGIWVRVTNSSPSEITIDRLTFTSCNRRYLRQPKRMRKTALHTAPALREVSKQLPPLPHTIRGYGSDGWTFNFRQSAEELQPGAFFMKRHFLENKRNWIRVDIDLSGHPRRHAYSKWISWDAALQRLQLAATSQGGL